MFLCYNFFFFRFLIHGGMDEAEQNNFHSSVCHGPEFSLVIKVMNLTMNIFLKLILSGSGS